MRIDIEFMKAKLLMEFYPWRWAHIGTNSFEVTWSSRETFFWPDGQVRHWLAEWKKSGRKGVEEVG